MSCPNHLFGQNPYAREFADTRKIPLLAALGGAETMYPELVDAVRDAAAAERAAKARMMPAGPPAVSRAPDPTPKDGEIHTFRVSGNVYLLAGDGANIAVQVGPQGAFVVDTGAGQLSDKVVAAIAKLSAKPIQFIVNTTFRPDHTGGNAKLQTAGADPSLTGTFFSMQFQGAGQAATIISQLNTQTRMNEQKLPAPPSDTFVEERRRKHYNGEAVEVFPQPNATTDGDSIVHFRRADVIVAGDIFTTTEYPHIDTKNGGSVQGEIQALNFILDRTVYVHDEDGGTLIIPGTWPRDGRMGGRGVSRHGGHHSRPRAGADSVRRHAAAGAGGKPDGRLRRSLWRDHRAVDDRHVRRSGLHESEESAEGRHRQVAEETVMRRRLLIRDLGHAAPDGHGVRAPFVLRDLRHQQDDEHPGDGRAVPAAQSALVSPRRGHQGREGAGLERRMGRCRPVGRHDRQFDQSGRSSHGHR